jgi:hypothetical protein
MKISPRRIVKFAVRTIVAGSAGTTVHHMVSQNTEPDEESRLEPARTAIGSAALGWIVQDYVGRWTDEQIDEVFDAFSEFKIKLKFTAE